MLIVMLISLAVMLFTLLWLGSSTLQRMFYPDATEGLAWRAAAGTAAVMALYVLWCWLNTAPADPSELPYTTLFEFSGYTTKSVPEFTSIKRSASGKDTSTVFQRRLAVRGASRYYDDKGRLWTRSDSGMVIAIEIAETEGGPPTRFETALTPEGNFRFSPDGTVRYQEVNGSRFMDDATIGEIVTPRTGRVAGNLALNLGHLAIWVVVFLLLQFGFWHAMGLAVAAWLAATLVLLPTLFQQLAG
jgi:hypothetical protein